MGISLRHHVLSLVAGFLMLLVGLLVGIGLSSEPGLQQAIDKLNERFEELWSENSALRDDVEKQERFARAALAELVQGRLDGQAIPVLVTARPQDSPHAPAVADALTAAGADVPYRLILRKDFIERATTVYGGDSAAACERAAQELARGVAASDEDALHALRKRKLLRIDGDVPATTPDAVVVLGGAETEAQRASDTIDRPLVEALIAAEIGAVVGCEDSPEASYVETYRELDVPTVDNVDLSRGQFSLVSVLAGQPGNYGDQPSAEEEFPQLR